MKKNFNKFIEAIFIGFDKLLLKKKGDVSLQKVFVSE